MPPRRPPPLEAVSEAGELGGRATPARREPGGVRIATWNVNSLRVRLGQVLTWLERECPDVLALQETKLRDEQFPVQEFTRLGYRAEYYGQPTYNGVATLSRTPAVRIQRGVPDADDPQCRGLCTWFERPRLVALNLYVPNGSEVGSDKYRYKLDWMRKLHDYVNGLLDGATDPRLAVLGDFNVAPEDRDVHDPEQWQGRVLVSEPERERFRGLLGLGLEDCFRRLNPEEGHYTWWDYRARSFHRNQGLRIDHILASHALASRCNGCLIDRVPRTLGRPSDHAPVIAAFRLD